MPPPLARHCLLQYTRGGPPDGSCRQQIRYHGKRAKRGFPPLVLRLPIPSLFQTKNQHFAKDRVSRTSALHRREREREERGRRICLVAARPRVRVGCSTRSSSRARSSFARAEPRALASASARALGGMELSSPSWGEGGDLVPALAPPPHAPSPRTAFCPGLAHPTKPLNPPTHCPSRVKAPQREARQCSRTVAGHGV